MIAQPESRKEMAKFIRLAGLHLHRIRCFGSNGGKPYMRWMVMTGPSVICKRDPSRCLILRARDDDA